MNPILEFQNEYRWLSNFWDCKVYIDGIVYPSTEHAFQAYKTLDKTIRKEIANMPYAAQAKKAGKTLALRPDWEQIKRFVMYNITMCKYTQNPLLMAKLLATGDARLVEGNSWGDNYWGVDNTTVMGEGENWLGRILMDVREQLRNANEFYK